MRGMVHAAVSFLPEGRLPRPKRSWSQNFLRDASVAVRIAEEVRRASPGGTVLELGAGAGALTVELAARCGHVFALERDRDLAAVLRKKFAGVPNVEVLEDNALTVNIKAIYDLGFRIYDLRTEAGVGDPDAEILNPKLPNPKSGLVVVGNLPYHIASQIIFHLLEQREAVSTFILMLQKELAERICAGPGSRTYGVISVMCALHTEPRILSDVRPSAFHPRPRVVSSVVRFDVKRPPAVGVGDGAAFRRVVKAAFSQRRKTLANALKGVFANRSAAVALAAAGVDPGRRAETLSVAEFAGIARQVG
jgi:16S rRNA (adenine1518-N6/adenine1519-N6)-dimethyltransferase